MRLPVVACFTASLMVGTLRAAPPPDPSLLLWLPLDEGTGSTVTDRSPSALEADLTNIQWAQGAFGTAAHFGGTRSFADLPAVPGLNGATQFTLSVWAAWDEPTPRRYPNLLTTKTWSPGGMMLFVSDGACSFRLGRPDARANTPGSAWTETGVPLLSRLPPKRWVHLCVTFDRPALTAYADGKPVGRAAWPYALQADDLRLGGWNGDVCHYGLLSDLRIYSRALQADEVAALAHDPARVRADYALVGDAPASRPLAATFSNRRAVLSIDTRGEAASLRSRKDGRELLAAPVPFVSARLKDGRTLSARAAVRHGDDLTFSFARGLGSAVVGVEARRDFFTFTVRALTLTNVASLTFCALPSAVATYRGEMANMLSDDADAVCLRGYDLPVEMELRGNVLSASATLLHGLTGVRAGLAAGPKPEMPTMLRAMAEAAGVPTSTLGGPWSLGAEENRGSYLFADLDHAATDDWIELARRGGFSTVHIHGWWRTLGHYDVNTNLYPRGLADLRDAADRIHAAGLRAGIHSLTACIDPHDAWVTPEASPDLKPFDTYTLARPLSATDTVLYVNEPPAAHHDVVFTYMSNGNAIRIGSEILQYAEVRREPPYAFAKCTRGAFKTRAEAHPAGERADYLQQRYIAFYPQPDSALADDLAEHLADVFNTCRLDQLYCDGSEGMMDRYGIDAMRHKIVGRLKGDPLIEASCHGAHNWWFHSRLGAWDHPVWAAKRFQDLHIATSAAYRRTDLLEPQMGWWAPRAATPLARGHFLDEMEYFACKNLGLDAAMSVQGVNVSHGPLPFYIEKQITLLGWYEHLRLARYFDTQTVARVAVPGEEFRLRQNGDGSWRFTPVAMDAHRISRLGNGSERWSANNRYGDQPLSARIEALYAVAPYDSPKRAPLVGTSDFAGLTTQTAPSVSLRLSEETADARGADRSLRLRAANAGNDRRGAWACARLDFSAPYRSIAGTGAFGLWIKGDGSGALLNLQVGTPREYMTALSDHYVTLDFKGWRYVELLLRERDVGRMGDYVWPYAGTYDLYRNPIDTAHLSHVCIYLNDLPAGGSADIALSPVMALPLCAAVLKSPALTVNGQTLTLPFALASGEFAELEPDGTCTHYGENGAPLASAAFGGAGAPPVLRSGDNLLAFACDAPAGASARAEVTLNAFGAPFGTPNPRGRIGRKHLAREYEMTRLFATTNDLGRAAWNVAVRPGETARLEIELCGAADHPTLTVNGRAARFPIALAAGQRLLCRDGRHWTVLDAKRTTVAEGKLEQALPALVSGPNRVAFACAALDRVHVKLVKVYE